MQNFFPATNEIAFISPLSSQIFNQEKVDQQKQHPQFFHH